MNVEIVPASPEDKSVLANLLELYIHDLSEFYPELQINDHGRFGYRWLDHYWTDEDRFPYFIRANGKLAGFILVRESDGILQIAEFFVLKGFRRQGVGHDATRRAFQKHRGDWEVRHATSNQPAAVLWKSAVPVAAECHEVGTETVYKFQIQVEEMA